MEALFRNFVENLRKSIKKDKEIQESLKAFEDERSKIVKSDSVKLFRQQFSNARVSIHVADPALSHHVV